MKTNIFWKIEMTHVPASMKIIFGRRVLRSRIGSVCPCFRCAASLARRFRGVAIEDRIGMSASRCCGDTNALLTWRAYDSVKVYIIIAQIRPIIIFIAKVVCYTWLLNPFPVQVLLPRYLDVVRRLYTQTRANYQRRSPMAILKLKTGRHVATTKGNLDCYTYFYFKSSTPRV